jgi:hypothetical protein
MPDPTIVSKRLSTIPAGAGGRKSRIYVLLSVIAGETERAAVQLRKVPGVITADPLEGDPNLLLMVEASDRLELADSLMKALSVPGDIIEDLQLLITSE